MGQPEVKPYGVIYLVRNTINGKCYVGQTVGSVTARFARHCRTERSALGAAISKYDRDSFELTTICAGYSNNELDDLEYKYIKEFDCLSPNGYNLKDGGGSRGPFSAEALGRLKKARANPDYIANMQSVTKERWQDSAYRSKVTLQMKSYWNSARGAERKSRLSNAPVSKKILSILSDARSLVQSTPELRDKWLKSLRDPKRLEKLSLISKERWAQPGMKERHSAKLLDFYKENPEVKLLISKSSKDSWTPERRVEQGLYRKKLQSDPNLLPRSDSSSGLRGVRLHKPSGKWQARMTVNGKQTSLGLFDTADEARSAYIKAKAASENLDRHSSEYSENITNRREYA